MDPDEWLTVADVAKQLQVVEPTVRSWLSAGRLPYYQLGRVVRIRREDFLVFTRRPPGRPGPKSHPQTIWEGLPIEAYDGWRMLPAPGQKDGYRALGEHPGAAAPREDSTGGAAADRATYSEGTFARSSIRQKPPNGRYGRHTTGPPGRIRRRSHRSTRSRTGRGVHPLCPAERAPPVQPLMTGRARSLFRKLL